MARGSGFVYSGKEKFCRCLVTGNEMQIHHLDPGSKLESMQWKRVDSPPPKKFRTQPTAGKSYDNFLGFQRITYGRLFASKEDNYWPILCRNYV